MDYWEKNNLVKPQQVVVCAANRLEDGTILCGARHWDKVMCKQADMMGLSEEKPIRCEQGFINQFGEFLTRKESMQVVKENGQPFNKKRNGNQDIELYSEGLY